MRKEPKESLPWACVFLNAFGVLAAIAPLTCAPRATRYIPGQ